MDTKAIIQKLGDRPVVLVGMMGCGKSHIAKLLGDALGYDVYDSDALIEEDQNMSVSDIFSSKGELFFRDLEMETISSLLEKKKCVISTGGGALMRQDTLKAIKEYAVSIWINTDIDVLMTRLDGDQSRPLLAQGDARKRLLSLLEERMPLYAEADVYVENNADDIQALEEIGRAFAEYL